MARRNNDVEERENVRINNDVANSSAFFDFALNVMNAKNDVDVEALCENFDEGYVRTRKVGNKKLRYVPSKFIKERLNKVLGCKYSFFILREERITDPLPRYNRDEDSYVESDCYIKVVGCLSIMGLGVQVAYGVKKTYGYGESDDWKAAATDAFKKCCSMFGIEADYDIDDDDVDDDSEVESIDLDDVEYDEDSLNDALETELAFGKFKNLTLEEIYEEDPTYLEWLMENAKEKSIRENSAIVLKYFEDKDSKKKKSANTSKSKSKSSSASSMTKKSSSSSSTSRKSSSKKREVEEEDDEEDTTDERQELIDNIEEIFEEDEYDEIIRKQLIQSVSTSKKNPRGKTKLSLLTEKELTSLLEVLIEDSEDE